MLQHETLPCRQSGDAEYHLGRPVSEVLAIVRHFLFERAQLHDVASDALATYGWQPVAKARLHSTVHPA